jgi:hypothetical protein
VSATEISVPYSRKFDKVRKLASILIALLLLAAPALAENTVLVPTPSHETCVGIEDQIYHDVDTKEYSRLEALANQLLVSKQSFENGNWALQAFFDAFVGERKDWDAFLPKVEAWVKAYPNSSFARTAMTEAYLGYAWAGRGYGYADKVSNRQWKTFEERTKLAHDTLEKARGLRPFCPAWYLAALTLNLAENTGTAVSNKLVDECMAKEPTFYNILNTEASYNLQPKWCGSSGEWQRFAAAWADKVGGDAGDILYARIIWQVDGANPSRSIIQPGVSWKRMKHGFDLLMRKYPNSLLVASRYALYAGQANDFPTVKWLFVNRLQNKADKSTWKTIQRFNSWKAWVATLPNAGSSRSAP